MNPRPINVKPLKNFELLITFQNGEKKLFDVKPLLPFPLYAPLKNEGMFSLVKADGMCIYWNEDIDICPDMVYTNSRPLDSGYQPVASDGEIEDEINACRQELIAERQAARSASHAQKNA